MSCPYQKALYDWPHGPHDAETLRKHAASCPTCSATIIRIESARRALRTEVTPMTCQARSALWQTLQSSSAPSKRTWMDFIPVPPRGLWVAGLATAACVLLLWRPSITRFSTQETKDTKTPITVAQPQLVLETGPSRPLGYGSAVQLAPGSLVNMASSRLHAQQPSKIVFEEGPGLSVSRFDQGRITFDIAALERTPLADIVTPHAKIQALGTRFTVQVNERDTQIVVYRGSIEVTPNSPDQDRFTMQAGQRWSSSRQAPSPTAAPPKTAAPPRTAATSSSLPRPAPKPIKKPPLRPETLLTQADRYRRQRAYPKAIATYQRVVDHPKGQPYAEEALFRQAQLLTTLAKYSRALAVLKQAERQFPRGALRPERIASTAKIWLLRHEDSRAADVLETSTATSSSWLLQKTYIEVAQRLVESHPTRAQRLLTQVKAMSPTKDVLTEAQSIERTLEGKLSPASSP